MWIRSHAPTLQHPHAKAHATTQDRIFGSLFPQLLLASSLPSGMMIPHLVTLLGMRTLGSHSGSSAPLTVVRPMGPSSPGIPGQGRQVGARGGAEKGKQVWNVLVWTVLVQCWAALHTMIPVMLFTCQASSNRVRRHRCSPSGLPLHHWQRCRGSPAVASGCCRTTSWLISTLEVRLHNRQVASIPHHKEEDEFCVLSCFHSTCQLFGL